MSSATRPTKRFEDHRLLTGAGSFLADIQLPEMLHAAVVRSPHAHALVRGVDISAAKSLTGVVAVVTGQDLIGVLEEISVGALWPDESILVLNAPPQPVLAGGRVCYVGQAVAMVVAESSELARDGLELVQVDYEPLPAILDPFDALKEEVVPMHAELGTNLAMHVEREGGDLDGAFDQADRVIKAHYEVQRVAPAPLENRGVVAHYQPQTDMLTVWDSTQEPHQVLHHVAKALSRPEARLRIIAPDVGGGFGEKGCVFPEEILVPYLAITLGRPIRWLEDRQENMLAFHARGHTVDVEAAVKVDGTILGIKVYIMADLGAYFLSTTYIVPMHAGRRIAGPYKTPAMGVEVLGALTNKPPTGPYRGAGGPEAAYCMERTIDVIARDLELDPVAVRLRNFIPADGFPHETPTGLTYDSGDYQQGLDRVLELGDYRAWREKARQRGPGEPLIGVGLATVVKASGGGGDFLTEVASIHIDSSGNVTAYTGLSPHGQGTETTFALLVSSELGVDPSGVEVLHSDTAMVPTGHGTAASRGTVVGASALYEVLLQAREKLARIAAHFLQCSSEEVAFEQGKVFNRQWPESSLEFSEVAAAAYSEERLPPGVTAGLEFSGSYTLPQTPFAYAAHVAVVEVDPDTGETKILHYAAVHDCGRILNHKLVEGQAHGGISQGVGQAMIEGIVYSPGGQPLTGSLMDYAVPLAEDFPDIVMDTIETPSPLNPLGVKGVGELPTVAAPVAVTNAVMDALAGAGVRHIDTPLTPEKIWRALQTGNRQK